MSWFCVLVFQAYSRGQDRFRFIPNTFDGRKNYYGDKRHTRVEPGKYERTLILRPLEEEVVIYTDQFDLATIKEGTIEVTDSTGQNSTIDGMVYKTGVHWFYIDIILLQIFVKIIASLLRNHFSETAIGCATSCQNYMMIPLVFNSPNLRQCIALFAVAEGWLLLDIGWFVLCCSHITYHLNSIANNYITFIELTLRIFAINLFAIN